MPKGKRGPVPPIMNDTEDPTAEQIVGEENVVDVGSADTPSIAEMSGSIDLGLEGYRCADCTFGSSKLSELEAHCAETQHGGSAPAAAPEEPVQPELFSTPGVVHKMVEVPMADEFLHEKRARLAALYQDALDTREEKKAADEGFNTELKHIDQQMQEIARVLKTPFTYERVDCEWRLIENEHARGLYRLDTGEMIEKAPLSEEDRQMELTKAAADNSTEAPTEQPTEESAVTAGAE